MVRSVLLCDTTTEISSLHAAARNDPDLLVEVSTDGRRAIEAVARFRPDVVVCRLAMEGFTGTELLRRLRDASPETSIVVRLDAHETTLAASSIGAGARGVVASDDLPTIVLDTARAAGSGAVALSPRIALTLGAALGDAVGEAEHLRDSLAALRDSVADGTAAKADFLANISHELRTPVTVAKGIAYVLRNPSVGAEERTEFLGQLQGALDKLIGIVDEIITISELERGTFELVLADVDLAPAVHRALDAAREHHPTVRIVDSVASPLPAVVDVDRVEGVIRELLDNACRYSPVGEPVELVAREVSEGIVVSVTDRGVGLDRTVARRSFDEPFSTGEAVLRKEKSGIGVGLHLARQLVVEHGGTLWTDPLPGGGTRAAFCIPTRAARAARRPAGAA